MTRIYADSRELHLANASVTQAVDVGTAAIPGLPVDFIDFDGHARPQGGGVDIGSDEVLADVRGDADGDGDVDMTDAILALQVVSAMTPSIRNDYPNSDADVDEDGTLSLTEAVYILQIVSELRE